MTDILDGVLSLMTGLEVAENVNGSLLQICTLLNTTGELEIHLVVTLLATDVTAGE